MAKCPVSARQPRRSFGRCTRRFARRPRTRRRGGLALRCRPLIRRCPPNRWPCLSRHMQQILAARGASPVASQRFGGATFGTRVISSRSAAVMCDGNARTVAVGSVPQPRRHLVATECGAVESISRLRRLCITSTISSTASCRARHGRACRAVPATPPSHAKRRPTRGGGRPIRLGFGARRMGARHIAALFAFGATCLANLVPCPRLAQCAHRVGHSPNFARGGS